MLEQVKKKRKKIPTLIRKKESTKVTKKRRKRARIKNEFLLYFYRLK